MSKENVAASAPLHHVVGQLRELLIRSDIHTLTPSRHGFEAWDSANECCVLEGSAKAVAVTIAAVNALPALLAIAESAQEMRKVQRQCAYDASICAAGRTYSDETRISLEQDLDMALSSLPNREVCGPAPLTTTAEKPDAAGSVSTAVVGQTESREAP